MSKIYETFSFSKESVHCYGLEIVSRRLRTFGYEIRPLDYNSTNTVLVSLYWPDQLFDFIKWRFAGVMKNKRVLVGGNYPTTSPAAILPFCDGIFLGDGEGWNGSQESEYIITKETTKPVQRYVEKNIVPFNYEDVQFSRRSFVEISRGCKNKCLFCQYGWLKSYREADFTDINEVIKRVKTKSVRVFAADRFQHSKYSKIRAVLDTLGKCDTGSDVSIRFLLKHPEYLKFTNKVRTGIEGMSERLRRMVLKNFTDDDLCAFSKLVSDSGIKCLDYYMIYGLPTENDSDVDAFYSFIEKLDGVMPEKYTIAIHWNAFTPSAQTPFQWEAPAIGDHSRMKAFFESRPNKKICVYHKPKLANDWTLIRRMLAIRADTHNAKLCFNFAMKESEFKKRPETLLNMFQKESGCDLVGAWPKEKPFPWDKYCVYEKDKMLLLADCQKRKYGQ